MRRDEGSILAGILRWGRTDSKPNEERALRSPTRQRLHEVVRATGGLPIRKLARTLGLTWGAVHYHVARLESAGLVRSRMVGRRRYVFPPAAEPHEDLAEAIALLEEPTARRIALAILQRPHMGMVQVMEETAVTQRVAYYHVKRLMEAGVIQSSSKYNYRGLSPTAKLYALVDVLLDVDMRHPRR